MRLKTLLTVAALCSVSAVAKEHETFYGNGYTIVSTTSKSDDLNITIYKRVRPESVFVALSDLLEGTGWQLADLKASDPNITKLYSQRLPDQKKIVGPMQLDDALSWFAGKAWTLVVDRVNKLVSFELVVPYKHDIYLSTPQKQDVPMPTTGNVSKK